MAGKGGGAWKVAYADFVTAMMAFFMVMWLVGQKNDVRESISNHFKEPTSMFLPGWVKSGQDNNPRSTPQSDAMKPGTTKQGSDVRGRGSGNPGAKELVVNEGTSSRRPKILRRRDGLESGMGTRLVFREDSASLDSEAEDRVKKLVPNLIGKPNKIEVRGHSTRRPMADEGEFKSWWDICYARATETMKLLVKEGVEPERIRISLAGPYEPFTIETDRTANEQNSYVEVFALNEYAEDLVGTASERDRKYSSANADSGN